MRYRGLGSSITGNTHRDGLRYEISGVGRFIHRQIHRGTDLDIGGGKFNNRQIHRGTDLDMRYRGLGSSITGKYTEGRT